MTNQDLNEIMAGIQQDYKTEIVPITVAGRTLRFLQIADLDNIIFQLLATSDLAATELPFWGKIWEASILLAAYLAAQPAVPGRQILEIGSGMGVSGLFAAACGHEVILSDHEENILRFIRANALLNNLDNVSIIDVDWSKPAGQHRYDWIVGAEVVYHRPTYDHLVQFLQQALKPNGTIFLTKSTSLPASGFFSRLTQHFKFKKLDKVMRSEDKEFAISLYAIKRKEEV
ncbi:MAG: methyltransferase [Syntrophobacterales bacterium]